MLRTQSPPLSGDEDTSRLSTSEDGTVKIRDGATAQASFTKPGTKFAAISPDGDTVELLDKEVTKFRRSAAWKHHA